MLCLKMILPSITINGGDGRSKEFTIVAPDGDTILATRFDDRDEGSESVSIREYQSYTFEELDPETAESWTVALLDELGDPVECEQISTSGTVRVVFRRMGEVGIKFSDEPLRPTVASVVDGSLAAQTNGIKAGMVLVRIHTPTREAEVSGLSASQALRELRSAVINRPLTLDFEMPSAADREAPTEQADDLGPDEMENLVASTRLELATGCLTQADYENAIVAFNAALQLAPSGKRAAEARRGLEEARKGLALVQFAPQLEQAHDTFRQSIASADESPLGQDPSIDVQQILKNQLGVEVQVEAEEFNSPDVAADDKALRDEEPLSNSTLITALKQAEETAALHGDVIRALGTQIAELRMELAVLREEKRVLRDENAVRTVQSLLQCFSPDCSVTFVGVAWTADSHPGDTQYRGYYLTKLDGKSIRILSWLM